MESGNRSGSGTGSGGLGTPVAHEMAPLPPAAADGTLSHTGSIRSLGRTDSLLSAGARHAPVSDSLLYPNLSHLRSGSALGAHSSTAAAAPRGSAVLSFDTPGGAGGASSSGVRHRLGSARDVPIPIPYVGELDHAAPAEALSPEYFRSPSPPLAPEVALLKDYGPRHAKDDSLPDGMLRPWEQVEYGQTQMLALDPALAGRAYERKAGLGQLLASAVAGNDVTSSILFVAGMVIQQAGVMGPPSLLLVAFALHFYRGIFVEVVSALPFNGGVYTAILNCTQKLAAGIVAALCVLDYVGTALVSAAASVDYLSDFPLSFNQYWYCMLVLLAVCALTLLGLNESAVVSAGFFVIHLITCTILLVTCVEYAARDGGRTLLANYRAYPTDPLANPQGSIVKNLFAGYVIGLLGVTGFETSSNYVEETSPGVFPKTLRNMWWLTTFFNPALSFLTLACLPLADIQANSSHLLSYLGQVSGGLWLRRLVVLDAFLILIGTVVTAFVGVTGLLSRMSTDRVLPSFLNRRNRLRGSNHYILIGFFLLTISLWVSSQNMAILSGVWAIAFLGVLAMMAVADMFIKYKRDALRREQEEPWRNVIVGFVLVVVALGGTVNANPVILEYFAIYFGAVLCLIFVMYYRVQVFNFALYTVCRFPFLERRFRPWLSQQLRSICTQPVVFFTKSHNIALLNKVVQYVRDNEDSNCMYVAYVGEAEDPSFTATLERSTYILDRIYPKLKVSLLLINGVKFGPWVVPGVSQALRIPPNFMFMSCPGKKFPYELDVFGGVRLVARDIDHWGVARHELVALSPAQEESGERHDALGVNPMRIEPHGLVPPLPDSLH